MSLRYPACAKQCSLRSAKPRFRYFNSTPSAELV